MARVIGLPWYRPEDYERLRAQAADPHTLASSYAAWLASAENNERVAADAGLTVVRVIVDPEVFASWCQERSLLPDGAARRRFAAETAQERAGQ